MKPEEIKVGRFYRFGASSMVLGIVGEWPGDEDKARTLEYFAIDHTGTICNWSNSAPDHEVAAKVTEQVSPTWTSWATMPAQVCRARGFHSFPNGHDRAATCRDCGITLGEAAAVAHARAEDELAAAQAAQGELAVVDRPENPAGFPDHELQVEAHEPEQESSSASFAASLLKGAE